MMLSKHIFSGQTMGTTYSITCFLTKRMDISNIGISIKRCIKRVNRSMSTYDKQSELSLFNVKCDTTAMPISKHFYYVLTQAALVFQLSNGAWDGTLKPIVDLWGFGPKDKPIEAPSDSDISKIMHSVGFLKIKFYRAGRQAYIQKTDPNVTLDLGSIAKGYAVDQIAEYLKKTQINNFIVEVGGEIMAVGKKPKEDPWVVGVNWPEKHASLDKVFAAIFLKNQAVATSGNYRQWIDFNGDCFSHTIDPRTYNPLKNNVASATVIAPNCTLADGLATALMILGPVDGLRMIDSLHGISGLVITQTDHELKSHPSLRFNRNLCTLN